MKSKQKAGSKTGVVPGVTLHADGTMVVVVKYPVPSLNKLFGMHPWSRYKEKRSTQAAFLSAFTASADALSIPTTAASSGWSIHSAISALSQTIDPKMLRSAFLKQRSAQKQKSIPES